ncbi:MAG: TRAP transporter large permease [Alphaproteobacteria bacterium]|nr:TRAP transporter large permease [Alphaproteobacteria bacterium]
MIALFGLSALALAILSVPIFLVFGVSSTAVALWGLKLPSAMLMQISFDAMTKQVLVAIPLFLFAGNVMLKGGTARRLVDLSLAAVGHLPGGLALAMILAMAFFAAFCGSILAAIGAIGTVLLPTMIERGYPKAFVIVLAACAAIIEALIPPSNTAILYSAITHVPVTKTFAAGVLPGLVLMTLLMLYTLLVCRNMPRPPRASWPVLRDAVLGALPALLTPVIIIGGIYGGLFTAAESAAVAGVWGIVLGRYIYRELTLKGLWEALKATAESTTVIFAIIAMAIFLSIVLTYTKTPQAIVEYMVQLGITQVTFFLAAGLTLLFLGAFIEVVPVFYLTLPIFIPVIHSLKIDTLQFYVFFTGLVGIGLLTPPVCVGVYMAASVVREPPERVFKAVPGFIVIGIIYAAIMASFPWLATWLPSKL